MNMKKTLDDLWARFYYFWGNIVIVYSKQVARFTRLLKVNSRVQPCRVDTVGIPVVRGVELLVESGGAALPHDEEKKGKNNNTDVVFRNLANYRSIRGRRLLVENSSSGIKNAWREIFLSSICFSQFVTFADSHFCVCSIFYLL